MKRLLALLGMVVLLTAGVIALTAGTAGAYPVAGADVSTCLICHDNPGGGAAYTAYRAAHDGMVGECMTCHLEPGESIHGEWGDTTAACARCHRTHSAAADGLLVMEEDALCEFCHGETPGLAQTNVMGGVQWYNSGSLRAGGFEEANMNTVNNTPVPDPDPEIADLWAFPVSEGPGTRVATSTHSLGVEALIWGSGDISATPNAGTMETTLKCVSCHDPHAFGETYRMLRKQPTDSGIGGHGSTTYAFVTDQLAYAEANPTSDILAYDTSDYTEVNYTSPPVYNETGSLVMVGDVVKHSQQLSVWCESCHERYAGDKVGHLGVGSTDTGDAIFAYHHKTGDEMTAFNVTSSCGYNGVACHGMPAREDANAQLSCLGCHVAHGTSAAMNLYAQIPWPGEDATTADGLPGTAVDPALPAPWDDEWNSRSSLLRLDNRGVCQNAYCHQKGTSAYLDGLTQGMDF